MTRVLMALGICLWSSLLLAQDCNLTLSGSIIDSHENTALEGAVINFIGESKIAYTDLDGRFEVDALCPAVYTIEIQHPLCNTMRLEINLTQDTDQTIYMEHHLEALNEVLITGQSYKTQSETLLNNTVGLQEIELYSSGSWVMC